jgi:rhodanese-related sulfurtransferase
LTTYLGWLLPWGSPLSLIGRTVDDVTVARRSLARIGIEKIVAWGFSDSGNGDDPWADLATGSYPVVGFGELKPYIDAPGEIVVDVRLGREWREGHLATAMHIPLHELPDRLDEVPAGRVWAHCAAGYRAAVAGSLLARAGRRVMVVSDQFSNAVDVGLDIVSACD